MTSYFEPIDQNLFNLGDLSTLQGRDITTNITAMNVSLSLDQSSQVAVEVLDPQFTFASANYFQIRRDIFYRNLWFEISAVSTQRSEAIHPIYEIECRSKAVQLMKRDKRPEAYRGMSAYEFAFTIAKRFNMGFVGERSTKKTAVVKGKTKDSDDSVWTVLQSLAQEQQMICFESENTLFFCSEKFLLGKWGDPNYAYGDFKFIPFSYPDSSDPVFAEAQQKYILLEQPSIRRSDDDIKAADGTLIVDRYNGVNLRPGMTIFLKGIPDFESFYIISSVTFSEGVNDPVRVAFRLPIDPSKEQISTSTASGSNATSGNRGTNPIAPVPGQDSASLSVDRQKISVAQARIFVRTSLQKQRYRGPDANAIVDAVANEAVGAVIAGMSVGAVLRQIRQEPGVQEQTRDLIESILLSYLSGESSDKSAIAGGKSTSARQETADQAERRFATPAPKGTPTINSSSSLRTVSTAPLPQQVKTLIADYIISQVASIENAEVGTILPTASSKTNSGETVPYPIVRGNIRLSNRPQVRLEDGSVATIRSVSFGEGGVEVVIPTIGPNGEDWTFEQAYAHYLDTGQHLGKLSTTSDAETYAIWLHEQEEKRISKPASFSPKSALLDPALTSKIADATQRADKIFKLSSNSAKQDAFRQAHKDWQAINDRVKYNAIVQAGVLTVIAPDWDKTFAGVKSVQILPRW